MANSYQVLKRQWISLKSHQESHLRVVHFNVLADQLTSNGGWLNTRPEDLEWSVRSDRLLDLIKEAKPDLLSLAECDHYEDFWQPELAKLGLIGIGPAVKYGTGKTHGVVLFVSATRFEILNTMTIRDGVAAIIQQLFDRVTEKNLVVLNTHLKAKPESALIRSDQLELIYRHYNVMNLSKWPTIFMGDFNAPLVEKSLEAMLQYFEVDTALIPTADFTWTTWKERGPTSWYPKAYKVKQAIDHILVSSNVRTVGIWCLPDDDEVEASGLLPGSRYPSDHLAIGVDLVVS